jgi:uncharacterized ferredoxin-like protein
MKNALKMAADLMALSARTAPKTVGKDYIEIKVIDDESELAKLGEQMAAYGEKHGKRNYDRDGRAIAGCGAVLLVAIKDAKTSGLNCGACGYDECTKLPEPHDGTEFAGPFCAWRLVDLGIAIGSAAKTASMLNVDNRIMYRIGVVARKMNLIDGDVVLGIPLSATGKNIFFDR